jgi:hypothetical protein
VVNGIGASVELQCHNILGDEGTRRLVADDAHFADRSGNRHQKIAGLHRFALPACGHVRVGQQAGRRFDHALSYVTDADQRHDGLPS